ncbi:hypothetical protein NPIL_368131 [Nephila pilipes]|uniref:Uncharacterized protein n=1 Tax=Nephila pilipes TaxID=299642 RepID=A0A8X6QZV5_NEPPI|nr:hypothetical protein NPIL_368131 [Nephila pilipes]
MHTVYIKSSRVRDTKSSDREKSSSANTSGRNKNTRTHKIFVFRKETSTSSSRTNIKTDEGVQQTQTTRRSHKEDGPGEEKDSERRDTSRKRLQVGRRTGQPLLGKAPDGGREAMLLGGSGGDHPQ